MVTSLDAPAGLGRGRGEVRSFSCPVACRLPPVPLPADCRLFLAGLHADARLRTHACEDGALHMHMRMV